MQVVSRAEAKMEELFRDRDIVTTNLSVTSDSIRMFFNKTRQALNQRESALLSTVQKYTDIKLTKLDIYYQKLQGDRDSIIQTVDTIEKMVQNTDDVNVLMEQQTISEQLDLHQQSVLSICDSLQESRPSNSFLSFKEDYHLQHQLSNLGNLNECRREPDSIYLSVRKVVVTEEEDPYLDVPLRFEDETDSRQSVRIDETHREYEPTSSSGAEEGFYDSPKPIVPQRKTEPQRPVPKPRRRPPIPVRTDSSLKPPPRPPKPTDSKHPPSARQDLYDSPRPTCINKEHSFPRVSFDCEVYDVPKSPHSNRDREVYDVPKSPHSNRDREVYDVPKSPHSNRDREVYDVPKYPHSNRDREVYDVPKSPHSNRDHVVNGIPRPANRRRFRSDSQLPVCDEDDYEPISLCPLPTPCLIPPPLPPNHPNQPIRPVPTPRRNRAVTSARLQLDTCPEREKPRSRTLPVGSMALFQQVDIVQPIMVLGSASLSWPFSQEKTYPCGVCCTSLHDTLVVSDVYNHCIRLIDCNGTFIEKIGKEGRGGGEFKEPSAVAVTEDNHIFVAERDNPRVQKFTATGKYLMKFGQKALWGTQLSDPFGIALSPDGNIYVSDWDKNVIFVFQNNGKLLFTIGKDDNTIKFPAGIAFDKQGRLLVADRSSHCVWILTPRGEIVGKISSEGSKPGQLYYPYGIAVNDEGQVIVTESGNDRVSIFSSNGRLLYCFGTRGSEPGTFNHPRHVCVNSKGYIIVADEMNQRLQIFNI